jgi:hypothetical protein
MPRVDLSSERVDKIVLDKELIPGIDKVYGEIISDLNVTIQSKEPLEGTIDGVMEGNRIYAIVTEIPKEILVVARSDVYRLS